MTKDSSLSDVDHIRHAHYKLAYKFHPDKNGGTQESNDVMAVVNNAVDVVKELVKNVNNHGCNTDHSDDLLREIDSKYGSFQKYFLTASDDQEVSAPVSAEPTVQVEYTGDQANFTADVAVG